jgi:hypothetical protein
MTTYRVRLSELQEYLSAIETDLPVTYSNFVTVLRALFLGYEYHVISVYPKPMKATQTLTFYLSTKNVTKSCMIWVDLDVMTLLTRNYYVPDELFVVDDHILQ